jgi:hypothetical protein
VRHSLNTFNSMLLFRNNFRENQPILLHYTALISELTKGITHNSVQMDEKARSRCASWKTSEAKPLHTYSHALPTPGNESSTHSSMAVAVVSPVNRKSQHGGQKPKMVVILELVQIAKRFQHLHPYCLHPVSAVATRRRQHVFEPPLRSSSTDRFPMIGCRAAADSCR